MKRLSILALLAATIQGQLCLRHPLQRGLSADCSGDQSSCIGIGQEFENAPQCTKNNLVSGFFIFSNQESALNNQGGQSGSEDGVDVYPSACGGTWSSNDPPSEIPESNVWITGSSVVVDIILVNDQAGGHWAVDFSPTPYPSGSQESPSRDDDAVVYDFQKPLSGTCTSDSPGQPIDPTQGVSQVSCTIDVPAYWQTTHGILRAVHRRGGNAGDYVACASIRVVAPDHYRFLKNTLCDDGALATSDSDGCEQARQEGFSNLPSSAPSAALGVAVVFTILLFSS